MTGVFKDQWACPLPFIPGYDMSGVVEEVGKDVYNFVANWGKVRHDDDEGNTIASTFAEYIDLPAYKLSHKPKQVSHTTAAAAAVVVCGTALQALNVLKVTGGAKILIIGGSSALGADRVINYNERAWWEETSPEYDIVIDAVGEKDAFLHAQPAHVVKFGGSFLSVADFTVGFNPAAHAPRFTFAAFFGSHQDSTDQDTFIQLVAEGKLHVPIDAVFPFTQEEVKGIFNKVKEGKSLGKNVLQIVV